MMTKILIDEATVKLAMEALENWLEFDPENFGEVDNKAITALRKALAGNVKETQKFEHEPAQQEPVAWMDASGDIYKHELWPNWNPPHTPLYTTSPAQQDIQRLKALVRAQQITIDKLEAQQEPVYVYTCKGCQALFWENDLSCDCTVNGLFDFNRHILSDCTSPPAQRTWVGLTPTEKHELRYSCMTSAEFIDVIEAKIKEKNQ